MADESYDVDHFEGADNEAVIGGGGYVDDDIDIDDDDDDEPLVASTPRANAHSSPALHPIASRKRSSISSTPLLPQVKKPRTESAHPNDFFLRAAGTGDVKDYMVAKFINRMPDFSHSPLPHVRLYRDGENTVNGRKEGLEAHVRQEEYYKTFSGKNRLQRYKLQGIDVVPDRRKKGFKMEVTAPHVAQQLAEQHKERAAKQMEAFKKNPMANGMSPEGEDAAGANEANGNGPDLSKFVDSFTGVFDGKTRLSRYAIMVMNDGSKSVDVIPIDPYAWFTFRADRNITNLPEGKPATKKMTKGEQRMARLTDRYNAVQMKREHAMGDDTRVRDSGEELAEIGIRRKQNRVEDVEIKGEDLDYDEDFADDDVAQVDKESIEKNVTRVLGDAEQNRRDFKKLIKDEPVSNFPPRSPGSESDEDPAASQGSRQPSRTSSPQRPPSANRSPRRAATSSPSYSPGRGTPMGASPSTASPSPSRGSRGNTPKRIDVSHLLPPAGVHPTREQVAAVVRAVLNGRDRMPFKECLSYFDVSTADKKHKLQGLLKVVTQVTSDPKRPKRYLIALKPAWQNPT